MDDLDEKEIEERAVDAATGELRAKIAALEADAAVMRRKVEAAEGMATFMSQLSEIETHGQPTSHAMTADRLLTAWQEATVDKPIDPPPGCQEIPGFILQVKDGWVTQDGQFTTVFSERGVWPTQAEAEAARDALFADDRLY